MNSRNGATILDAVWTAVGKVVRLPFFERVAAVELVHIHVVGLRENWHVEFHAHCRLLGQC